MRSKIEIDYFQKLTNHIGRLVRIKYRVFLFDDVHNAKSQFVFHKIDDLALVLDVTYSKKISSMAHGSIICTKENDNVTFIETQETHDEADCPVVKFLFPNGNVWWLQLTRSFQDLEFVDDD